MKTRRLLWIIPLTALLLVIAVIIALPGLVASTEHRTAIESLASSLTGRDVHIGGKLSLALFPEPQLIAERITISGPDQETITAKSLTLDIALNTLLHGRLTARSMTLQSPVIAFPWPLPGGAAAVAPPPWLAALHAQINDGQISLGGVQFQHVNADLFTGADGAVSIAGTGTLLAQPVTVSLGLGPVDATGAAPLTIDAQDGNANLHLSGSFSAASTLTGGISLNTPAPDTTNPALSQPITANATITANPDEIDFTNLHITAGNGAITGTARLDIAASHLELSLNGSNVTLPTTLPAGLFPSGLPGLGTMSVHITFAADDPIFAGVLIPHLWLETNISTAGINIAALNAALPGNGAFQLSGMVDPAGNLQGSVSLNSQNLSALSAAFGTPATVPDAWRQTSISAALLGNTTHFSLGGIAGKLGGTEITGTAVIDNSGPHPAISGAVHFDQLDLTPFAAAVTPLRNTGLTGDIELTAGRASFHNIPMTRLLIDAAFGQQLAIRRFSAAMFNGMVAGSFTVAPGGQVSAARALLSLPSATPAAAMLPAAWQPPAAVTQAPLAAYLRAAGPPQQLAASITLTLGDISTFASPVADLTKLTAAGPFLLRHPSAIALFKTLGLNSGLTWPGAGSVSLRADFSASPQQFALPDFVLSMGDLTAAGKISLTPDGQVNGAIAADTLALPPWPADLSPFWNALSAPQGKINLTANRVLIAGNQVFGASAASLALQGSNAVFTLGQGAFGGGTLSGNVTATISPTAPPVLAGTFALNGADVSAFNLPVVFPVTFTSGTINANGTLTASGYTAQAWGATLSGTAGMAASNGALNAFSLAALGAALTASPRATALRNATLGGSTSFAKLALTGGFKDGIYTISTASLQGPDGTATATGSIDVPDQGAALNFSLLPNVTPPPKLGVSIIGNWSAAKKIPAIKPGLSWQPQN